MLRPYLSTLALLVIGLAALFPGESLAQTTDSVAVLPTGPADGADVYSLRTGTDKVSVERTDRFQLVRPALSPSTFSDLKILDGPRNLLADFGDRGVATTDSAGAVDFQLAPSGSRPGITSASIAGYNEADRPVRILAGDENNRTVAVYDRLFDSQLWSNTLDEPAAPIRIAQTIALPGRRVAVGVNWPALQLTAVDVYDLSAEDSRKPAVRFANREHTGAPGELVTDSDLDELRDLFALDRDQLLATTTDALLVVSLADESVETRLTLDDRDPFAGAFHAARQLSSGRIAAATVEPGVWTRSHPNHRVYWLDESISTIVARTPALEAAPRRVEPAGGHGGSGTSGFRPGNSFLPTASLGDLRVVAGPTVTPEPLRVRTTGNVRVDLRNPGRRPFLATSAAIRAHPEDCEATDGGRTLVERTRLVIEGESRRSISGTFELPADAATGTWCARLTLEDGRGNRRQLDPAAEFEVGSTPGDADAGTGRTVDPTDLGLRRPGATDTGGLGSRPTPNAGENGCGCRATGGERSFGGALFALGLAAIELFRRRRRTARPG